MKKNWLKIKCCNIDGSVLQGNFLYEKKNNYFFANRKCHQLFLVEDDAIVSGGMFLQFENYLFKFFNICKECKEGPSILSVNGIITPSKMQEILGSDYKQLNNIDFLKLNNQKSFVMADENNISKILEDLIVSRNSEVSRDLFVIIDSLDNIKIENLTTYLTLARSRNIYFIVLLESKNKFIEIYSAKDLKIIKENCYIKFTYEGENNLTITVDKVKIKQ